MKILMVGLGGIGQRHVRNLKTLLRDEVELLAYRTRQLQTVLTDRLQVMPDENLETLYQIQSFTDLGAGLEQKPEIAFICNPSSMHVQVALKAAQAGCHLFVEKPLSHTTSGVQELIDTVQKKSLVGYVGYQMRFHPCLVRAHDLLVQKAIGRVLSAQAEVGEFLPGEE
jgi:predicted dehydrogenase